MVSRKDDRKGEGARVKHALDALAAIDQKAFSIAFAIATDVVSARREGGDPLQGIGAMLYATAPKSLQARVDRMLKHVQPLLDTFLRPEPPPAHRRTPTARRGKTGRRRR
jgi:hypothetical protein